MQPQKHPKQRQNVMLRQWRPSPNVRSTILQSCLASFLLLTAGIWILITAVSLPKYTVPNYQQISQCFTVLHSSTPCTITLEVKQQMKKPVYLMYQLTHFYQNYKKFFTSKNNYQLGGNPIEVTDARKSCSPVVLNSDLYTNVSWNGTALNRSDVASPCGLVAYSFFNDTYKVFYPNGTQVPASESGIAWPKDKGRMYRQEPNSSDFQWIDPQNEHFIVWMRTSGFQNFQKPWAIINQNLPPGNYTIQITNNYNMSMFGGHKSVFLTSTSTMGGKNYFFPICLMGFGVAYLAGAVGFYWRAVTTGWTFGPRKIIAD